MPRKREAGIPSQQNRITRIIPERHVSPDERLIELIGVERISGVEVTEPLESRIAIIFQLANGEERRIVLQVRNEYGELLDMTKVKAIHGEITDHQSGTISLRFDWF